VKYYWNEARPGCAIPWMSSAKEMKKLSLLLLANNLLLKKLLRRLYVGEQLYLMQMQTTGSLEICPWRLGGCREKYLWELSVGHSRGVLHGSYLKIAPVGCPTGTILHGDEVFQSIGNDFPKVTFTLDGIWRHLGALFCNWEWINWFMRLFLKKKKLFPALNLVPRTRSLTGTFFKNSLC
jgi:hypothetical protein